MNLRDLIKKAEHSRIYRSILNFILWRAIPFNKPHRFRIDRIAPGSLHLYLPYIRKNKNHINGIHACALATASEYATGLCLMSLLSDKEFRIVLKSIHMDYHYQGKTDIRFDFKLDNDFMNQQVLLPLKTEDAIVVLLKIQGFDLSQNLISTGNIEWQIKRWNKVRTKV